MVRQRHLPCAGGEHSYSSQEYTPHSFPAEETQTPFLESLLTTKEKFEVHLTGEQARKTLGV